MRFEDHGFRVRFRVRFRVKTLKPTDIGHNKKTKKKSLMRNRFFSGWRKKWGAFFSRSGSSARVRN